MQEQFLIQILQQFSIETSEPETQVENLTLLEIWLISQLFTKEFGDTEPEPDADEDLNSMF